MECRNVTDALSDYLDGLLPGNEAGRIESHLTTCAPCQALRLELSEIRTAARDLPLHTPPRALWTRISNALETELATEQFAINIQPAWRERLKTRVFTLSLPQLAGAGVVALALIAFGIYRQDNPALTMRGMQTALLAEEAQLKSELDRKLETARARMSNWNPQRRAAFEQHLNRIETALQQCRQLLQANPNDQAQHSAMLNLYQEKRQLLESVEQSK